MAKDPGFEDTDAFFNMRRQFWVESRDRALTQMEQNQSATQGSTGDHEDLDHNSFVSDQPVNKVRYSRAA